jgi:hypothetical protein
MNLLTDMLFEILFPIITSIDANMESKVDNLSFIFAPDVDIHANIERIKEIFESVVAANFACRNIGEDSMKNLVKGATVFTFITPFMYQFVMTEVGGSGGESECLHDFSSVVVDGCVGIKLLHAGKKLIMSGSYIHLFIKGFRAEDKLDYVFFKVGRRRWRRLEAGVASLDRGVVGVHGRMSGWG